MAIETKTIEYTHNGTVLEGVLASDRSEVGKKPLVMVAHAWAGRSDFEVGIAKDLAGLGFAGFALDLYGKGVLGSSVEENQTLMTPFVEDRAFLQDRLKSAHDAACALDDVNPNKTASIGYCFGGLCVLDMARAGIKQDGVVSFHGLLGKPGNCDGNSISSKVLIMHGWDDPMVSPQDVVAVSEELTQANADWQLHSFGQTMHAFTNPNANDPDFGTVYNPVAEQRSWTMCSEFLAEILR